jgi:hypothetical protein
MLSEFEQIETSLIVEIIRVRQQIIRKNSAASSGTGSFAELNTINIDFNNSNNNLFNNEKCNRLEEDMKMFMRSDIGNEFADIFVILDENKEPIMAHKCILAARCAYFEAFFRSFMPKERKIKLTIGDTVPPKQTCMSLLRYIYYDEIIMPPEDSLYLFSASHYFQFSNLRLHVFCKQNLEINVSKNNVFDILEAADKINEKDMKNFALKIVGRHFLELAHSNRIKKLSKELLLDIITYISNFFTNENNKTSQQTSLL